MHSHNPTALFPEEERMSQTQLYEQKLEHAQKQRLRRQRYSLDKKAQIQKKKSSFIQYAQP
jgi:hypothetical protein